MRQMMVALMIAAATASAASAEMAIGDKLLPFTLTDATSGQAFDLGSVRGKKAMVLMFIATQCPVSNAYNERMATLAKEYGGKGVAFVGINSNRQEASEEVAAHAQTNGLGFPVLKDVDNVQADHFAAHVTPEVYLFDGDFRLRYHGRIDDDRSGKAITSADLRNAMDAVLAGKDVAVAQTKAFGCTIKRVAKVEAATEKAPAAGSGEAKPAGGRAQ